MSETTRERLLQVARRQFAEKGYYGASIASIADALGLTKQALLHHFGSKEKLYGEVLAAIATRLTRHAARARDAGVDPVAQLEAVVVARADDAPDDVLDAQLLMRELLDNAPRAEAATTWYLKPYLQELVAMVRRIPGEEALDDAEALATIYQLLGAANYLAMSGPTLTRMFGADAFGALEASYPVVLRRLIRARFATGEVTR